MPIMIEKCILAVAIELVREIYPNHTAVAIKQRVLNDWRTNIDPIRHLTAGEILALLECVDQVHKDDVDARLVSETMERLNNR